VPFENCAISDPYIYIRGRITVQAIGSGHLLILESEDITLSTTVVSRS